MDLKNYSALILGATGTGKSSLCNSLSWKEIYSTGNNAHSVTKKPQSEKIKYKIWSKLWEIDLNHWYAWTWRLLNN